MAVEVVFLVGDVLKDKTGRVVFVGYPTEGRSVRVGDKFIQRYEVPRTLDDVLNERPMAEPVNQRDIVLTVTAIDSMRKLIVELPLGVTGALYLSGDGIEHVTKNTFLRTAD
jgi:hypothetical protein